jgi:hypothetical protein
VDLDIAEILRADGGGVILHDVVGEMTQGQPPRLAGLLDDVSKSWWHDRHPLRFTDLQKV